MDDMDDITAGLFRVWSMMPEPALSPYGTIDETLMLAKLGKKHNIPALKNQAATQLRKKFMSNEWKVTPENLEKLWLIAREEGENWIEDSAHWIGRIVSILVGGIGHDKEAANWEELMNTFPELHTLHSRAILRGWSRLSLSKFNACEFHDHDTSQQPEVSYPTDVNTSCPFLRQECWPAGMVTSGDNAWTARQEEKTEGEDEAKAVPEDGLEEWQAVAVREKNELV